MKYPFLLFVHSPGSVRVSVRNFKSDAARKKAIAKLPPESDWSLGEQLQLIPLVESEGNMAYDARYDIPF